MIVEAGKSINYTADDRLEIQGKVNVAVLSLKSAGWNSGRVYASFWKQNCFFFSKPQSLFLRPSTY